MGSRLMPAARRPHPEFGCNLLDHPPTTRFRREHERPGQSGLHDVPEFEPFVAIGSPLRAFAIRPESSVR